MLTHKTNHSLPSFPNCLKNLWITNGCSFSRSAKNPIALITLLIALMVSPLMAQKTTLNTTDLKASNMLNDTSLATSKPMIQFNGQLLTINTLQTNYSTGGLVVDFGSCDSDANCAFWTSEVLSSSNHISAVELTIRVNSIKNETCRGGNACLNGYRVISQFDTTMIIDSKNNELRGHTTLSLGIKKIKTSRVTLEYVGHVEWMSNASGRYSVSAYNYNGTLMSTFTALAKKKDDDNYGTQWCQDIVNEIYTVATGSVATAASGYVFLAIQGAFSPASLGFPPSIPVNTAVAAMGAVGTAGFILGSSKTLYRYIGAENWCEDFLNNPEELDLSQTEEKIDVNGNYETSTGVCPDDMYASVCEDCRPTVEEVWEYSEDGTEAVGEQVEGEVCEYVDCCVAF